MKINDYEIFNQLNKNYNAICNMYGEANVYGIFAFGKVNTLTGIQSIEELTTEAIIFPNFEQVCINLTPPVKTLITIEDNHKIMVKDIRCIYADLAAGGNTLLQESLETNYRIINLAYEKLFDMYMLNNKEKMLGVAMGETDAINELKLSVVEILRTVFNNNSTSISFIKHLTDSEKVGLSAILERLNCGEGVISIAKLCKDIDISRYVLDRLLQKLKESKLATITLWGAHGTYIKITDYRLLNF